MANIVVVDGRFSDYYLNVFVTSYVDPFAEFGGAELYYESVAGAQGTNLVDSITNLIATTADPDKANAFQNFLDDDPIWPGIQDKATYNAFTTNYTDDKINRLELAPNDHTQFIDYYSYPNYEELINNLDTFLHEGSINQSYTYTPSGGGEATVLVSWGYTLSYVDRDNIFAKVKKVDIRQPKLFTGSSTQSIYLDPTDSYHIGNITEGVRDKIENPFDWDGNPIPDIPTEGTTQNTHKFSWRTIDGK